MSRFLLYTVFFVSYSFFCFVHSFFVSYTVFFFLLQFWKSIFSRSKTFQKLRISPLYSQQRDLQDYDIPTGLNPKDFKIHQSTDLGEQKNHVLTAGIFVKQNFKNGFSHDPRRLFQKPRISPLYSQQRDLQDYDIPIGLNPKDFKIHQSTDLG